MDKKLLKRSLQQHTNGAAVISKNQLETFLGIGGDKVTKVFGDLPMLQMGDRKKYFIEDVAERIMERTQKQ